MQTEKLEAQLREKCGKTESKKLRNLGLLPSVIYGTKIDPIHIAVNPKELTRIFKSKLGRNTLIQMALSNGKSETVITYQFAIHPVTREIIHVDFLKVDPNRPIPLEIKIVTTGVAPGVKLGGIFVLRKTRIKVKCLPQDLVTEWEVDISNLEMGDYILVKDLNLPKSMILVSKPEDIVAQVELQRGTKEDEEKPGAAVAAEGVAGAEAVAGAEGAAPAAGDAKDKGAAGKAPEKGGKSPDKKESK